MAQATPPPLFTHRAPTAPASARAYAACSHCASSDTDVLTTMRRHTCDADDWLVCNECGHMFTPSHWPN